MYIYTATSHLCSFCHPSLATSGASLHWLKSFQELWLRSALKLQKRLAAGSWTNPKNRGFNMMKNQQERFFNIFQSETSLKTCRFLLKNLSLLPVQHASAYFNPWNWSNQPSTFLQFYPQTLWPAIDSPNQMEKQLPEPLRWPPPAGPLHVAPTVQGTVDESWCTCEKTTVTTVSTYQVSSSEDKSRDDTLRSHQWSRSYNMFPKCSQNVPNSVRFSCERSLPIDMYLWRCFILV